MKRLVSILTALAITLALLPATLVTVSAADEADMVFDFSKNTVNANDGTTRSIPFDSETQTTEGIVSEIWSAENTGDGWSAFAYSEDAEYLGDNKTYNRTFYQVKNSNMQINIAAKDEWVAFMLPIEAGRATYNAALDVSINAVLGKRHDIYFIPGPGEIPETDAEKRAYVNSFLYASGKVDTTYRVSPAQLENVDSIAFEVSTTASSSNYLLIFRSVYPTGNARLQIKTLELTKQIAPSEYNFDLTACEESSSPKYNMHSTEPSKVFSAEVTGNGWSAFVFKEDVLATNSGGTTNRTFMQTKDTNLIIEMEDANDWVSLLLPVSSGSYDAVLKSGTTPSYFSQGNHELYFIPITKSELASCSTDVLKREFVEGKIADRTCYAATTPRIPAGDRPTEFSFEVNMPETADYLVWVIKKTGKGTSDSVALHLSSLSLIKQPEIMGDTHESVKLYTYAKDGRGEVSGVVEDVASGAETTVTATANPGYEFAYWTDASGDFVSEKMSYTFTPYTNTVLVAVFKEKTASTEVGVDFYDANRDYLGFVPVTAGENFASIKESVPTPSMTGLKHIGWGIDKNTEMTDTTVIDKRVSVVALYEDEEVKLSQALTYMTDENAHRAVTSAVYGSEIKQTVSGVTKWYRDGKPVAYGDTYQYFVWDPTGITLSKAKLLSKRPIVLLDDPANGAYMIEYDEGNGTTLEAGLIFGNSAEINIGSYYAKAKTKEAKSHGQFSAKPASGTNVTEGMQTYVRGYLIYRDSENVIRVIYTDAAEITE